MLELLRRFTIYVWTWSREFLELVGMVQEMACTVGTMHDNKQYSKHSCGYYDCVLLLIYAGFHIEGGSPGKSPLRVSSPPPPPKILATLYILYMCVYIYSHRGTFLKVTFYKHPK